MPRIVCSPVARPDDQDAQLLSTLLTSDVPSRRESLRAARVRSTSQQRNEALRGYLLRNGFDRALFVVERVLIVAAFVAFGYWLLDGYGRDWLFMLRQAQPVAASQVEPERTPPSPPAFSTPTPSVPPEALAVAPLPFIHRDEESSSFAADDQFLVPQTMRAPLVADDPRPQRLSMPSVGAEMDVYEVFVRNNEWEVAEYAAGFHHGSALPGELGNTVLSGHAGLRGAVFQHLGRLKPGDQVVIETSNWRYTYQVRHTHNVWPHQVEVMNPTSTPVLTLITCTNWDTQRLIVVADLIDVSPLS
ncbi:sortase [Candidatus Chloroploca sp. Khr17]|uniref:sortase n=1 Tax=Candidatus Chloroploca sp. Khr17 TaxID=2496869 RepID=UPI00101D6B98|nr:sortase [Candidatus Chloroploca sp. Khr17]